MKDFIGKVKEALELIFQTDVTIGTVADTYTDLSLVLGDSPIALRIKHGIAEDCGGHVHEAVNKILNIISAGLLRSGRDLRFEFWFASKTNLPIKQITPCWHEKTGSYTSYNGVMEVSWAAWKASRTYTLSITTQEVKMKVSV